MLLEWDTETSAEKTFLYFVNPLKIFFCTPLFSIALQCMIVYHGI